MMKLAKEPESEVGTGLLASIIALLEADDDVEALGAVLEAAPAAESLVNLAGIGTTGTQWTPLLAAAYYNRVHCVDELLRRHGAFVDIACPDTLTTPLYVAVSENHVEIIRLLLHAGADPRIICEKTRQSPLTLAEANSSSVLADLTSQAAQLTASEERNHAKSVNEEPVTTSSKNQTVEHPTAVPTIPKPVPDTSDVKLDHSSARTSHDSVNTRSNSTAPQQQLPPQTRQSSNQHGNEYISSSDVANVRGAALESIVARVAAWIVSGAISFPYKSRYTTEEQVITWFSSLFNLPSSLSIKLGHYELHGFLGRGRFVRVRVDGPLQLRNRDTHADVRHDAMTWQLSPPRTILIGAGGPAVLSTHTQMEVQSEAEVVAPDVTFAPTPSDPWDGSCLHVASLLGVGMVFKPFDTAFNEAGGHIVDYFSEKARMAARRRDSSAAPETLWRQPAVATLIASKAVRKFHEVTDYSLRHGLYGNVSSCNLFHANLARALYELLNATRILDPCAGWGDRLVGALATPNVVRYLGFDPNPLLVGPHAEMVRVLGPTARKLREARKGKSLGEDFDIGNAFSVISCPFEDGVVNELFDLVLTSPPYFDLELYSDSAVETGKENAETGTNNEQSKVDISTNEMKTGVQSTSRFGSSLEQWLHSWYFPMLHKAWEALESGGHMAIYINDHEEATKNTGPNPASVAQDDSTRTREDIDICAPMLRYASSLPACIWVGVLGIAGETGSIRPLWLWRKGPLIMNPPASTSTSLPPLYCEIARLLDQQPRDGTSLSQTGGSSNNSNAGAYLPPHRRGTAQTSLSMPLPPPPPMALTLDSHSSDASTHNGDVNAPSQTQQKRTTEVPGVMNWASVRMPPKKKTYQQHS